LEYKACHIRTPKPDSESWGAEYIYDRHDKFCGFKIVQSTARTEVEPNYLALSIVRQFKTHDKLGNKILLRDFKDHYFDSRKARLTRERCENFFDNEETFVRRQGSVISTGRRCLRNVSLCSNCGRVTALRPTTQW
jgi:hypothetical protein